MSENFYRWLGPAAIDYSAAADFRQPLVKAAKRHKTIASGGASLNGGKYRQKLNKNRAQVYSTSIGLRSRFITSSVLLLMNNFSYHSYRFGNITRQSGFSFLKFSSN